MNFSESNLNSAPRNFRAGHFEYHQEIELDIEDITNLGAGVGRVDNFVVMVPFALAGERVRARVFRNQKNFSEADLVEVIKPSPDRVEPKCPLFGVCGGCQYQHLSYEAQLKWKQKQIKDLMQRIGGIADPQVEPTHRSPRIFGYRSKLTPHYERPTRDGKMPVGFVMQGRRNTIVDVENCPIASDAINAALPEIRAQIKDRAATFKRGGTVLLRDTLQGVITDNRATATERVGNLELKFVAGEFFQNNPFILPELLDYAADGAAGSKYLVDAYCGVGGFALWAAKRFERVVGIEISEKSIACAKENAVKNGIENCEFIAGSAEKIFAGISFKAEETSVIIDPPRAGCDETFLRQLVEFAPRKLVYVSCGPDTQARDIKYLTACGYEILKLQPFDLFPQTRHIENVCLLQKR
ncbi:MAG: class I SAM-dependent RNA methyltransferase [Opitutales bacterium]|nr:class I SAM-dependent RNA methyltransferase [Opitutales bacterium]